MNETPSPPIPSGPTRPWSRRWHSALKRGLLAVLAATAAEIVLAGLAMEFGKRFAFLFLVLPPCLILAVLYDIDRGILYGHYSHN